MIEMLLQSQNGEIQLLPALPHAWPTGTVTGLRARGGFEISLDWKNGKLQTAEIRSVSGTKCRVRYGEKTASVSLKPGQLIRLDGNLMTLR